jgi:hypothetical protein
MVNLSDEEDGPMPDRPSLERIHGSCHCGNIRFTFDRPGAAGDTIPVRACGCTLCRKHNAAWTSHPEGRFSLHIEDKGRVTPYQFGTKTADFHLCQTCGVIPIVTSTLDGNRYAVVNVHSFDNVDRSRLDESPTDFDGEGIDDRLARRKRNWTPEAL